VIQNGCQAGIAFDGDGDRVGFVTEKGTYITADELLMLLSKDILSRQPGGNIVATVSNSQALFDQIKVWGGKAVMCKVGHSYVENAMHESHAILGGEQSGHFFLPEDYYGYDDALVAALRTLDLLSRSGKTLSELVGELPKVHAIPERRPFCPDEQKFEVVQKITEHFSAKYPCSTLDGIRIDFGHGAWAGIRASNTSPRLSLIVEAGDGETLKKIDTEMLSFIKTFPSIDFTR
jgi:phosphomannomutase